jgi:hypothetical protein
MVITEAEEAVTDVLEIASLQLDHEPLRRPRVHPQYLPPDDSYVGQIGPCHLITIGTRLAPGTTVTGMSAHASRVPPRTTAARTAARRRDDMSSGGTCRRAAAHGSTRERRIGADTGPRQATDVPPTRRARRFT